MKQTAVEWLLEELDNKDWYYLQQSIRNEIIEQAKAMEKQQIIDAYQNVLFDEDGNLLTAEQYYNETFKQD